LSAKAWEDVRIRLSRLLEVNEYADMIRLCQNIDNLQEVRKRPDLWPEFNPGVEAADALKFGRGVVQARPGVSQLKKQTAVVKEHTQVWRFGG
jgi:hypothetical protein